MAYRSFDTLRLKPFEGHKAGLSTQISSFFGDFVSHIVINSRLNARARADQVIAAFIIRNKMEGLGHEDLWTVTLMFSVLACGREGS